MATAPMNLTLTNLLCFQTSWFACVLGAAQGRPMTGPIVVYTREFSLKPSCKFMGSVTVTYAEALEFFLDCPYQ
jgi:hypothetical protein